jgi:hypothetical protein
MQQVEKDATILTINFPLQRHSISQRHTKRFGGIGRGGIRGSAHDAETGAGPQSEYYVVIPNSQLLWEFAQGGNDFLVRVVRG